MNSLADRCQHGGITASEKILSVGNSFNCLGVSIPTELNAKSERDPKHAKKSTQQRKPHRAPSGPANVETKIAHGFYTSVWTYGCQFTDAHPRLDKKMQVETKKMTGYGTRFRCAGMVDTFFLKAHVVDPAQARIFRLVSNVLNILLENGPNRDRAIR